MRAVVAMMPNLIGRLLRSAAAGLVDSAGVAAVSRQRWIGAIEKR